MISGLLFLIFLCVLIAGIITHSVLRYLIYKTQMRYKSIDEYKGELNIEFDKIYHAEINNNLDKNIESDYQNLNIDSVDDSYNICYVRKFIWSSIHDSTIELADLSDNQYILDAGCGTCKTSIYLCKKFKNVKIDCIVNSEILYNRGLENIKKEGLIDRIKLYKMDFDNLKEPIINSKYDRIIFLESIDYSRNRQKLIDNMNYLLNEKGKLFIKTPSYRNNIEQSKYELCKDMIKIWRYNFSTLSSIINDFKKIDKYSDIKYISLNPLYSLFFLNPNDILNLIKFIKINKIKNIKNYKAAAKLLYEYNFIIATKTHKIDQIVENKEPNIKLEIIEKINQKEDSLKNDNSLSFDELELSSE